MPRLAEDAVECIELEWTKEEDGSYRRDQFRIVPSGGKFALEVTEDKGKKSKATGACKGPLKVCKGFALDISEGRLVKLDSGNWGTPPAAPEVKSLPAVQPAPSTPPVAPIEPKPLSPPVEPIKPADLPPLISIRQACAILSRELPISSLPPGSYFTTVTGQFGRFVEMIGGDAKVELEKGSQAWSSASPVFWLPCKVKGEVKTSPHKARAQSAEVKSSPLTSAEVKPGAAPKAPQAPRPDKSILGHHVKRVVMAMAVKAFTEAEIASVVKAFHLEVSPSRIALLRKRAINGEDGEPAPLTEEQVKQLKNIVGKK